MASRLERSVQKAVGRRRIFPYLAAATLILALAAGLVMTIVDEKDFPNFGLAVWWAIVTLATVGYGDVVPTTVAGRIVGSAVIIIGVTFLAFLTATVTSLFVSSDREAARERELADREAADKELRELLKRHRGTARRDRVEARLEVDRGARLEDPYLDIRGELRHEPGELVRRIGIRNAADRRQRAPVNRDCQARLQQPDRLGRALGVEMPRADLGAPAGDGDQCEVDGPSSARPSNRSVSPAK